VLQAAEALSGFRGDAVVLYADTPFLTPETLDRLCAARADHDVVVLGFEAADPGRYGRLVMEGDALTRIVEFKDATRPNAPSRLQFRRDGRRCRELLDASRPQSGRPTRRANTT
jgi:bifunctional N-acetylglucosamine-1-phosphate-uridyltransferase/glucosamine-1-phosphate-acetyltransferase GlmU-like protein